MTVVQAHLIEDEAGLAALAPAWEQLQRRLAAPLPFQSPAWLLPWWRAYHPGLLRVAACVAEGRLLGVLPLYLTPADGTLRPIGIGNSDYLDVALDPAADAVASLAELWRLVESGRDWTLCDLQPLPADSALLRHLPSVAGPDCAVTVETGESAPFLTLPDDPARLGDSVPKKMLRNLRNDRGRFAAAGGGRFILAEGETVAPLLDRMIDLHAVRWAEREGGSLLSGAIDRPFHHAAAAAAGRAGTLRLIALELGGVPAAVYYGFQEGAAAYAYLAGFDAAASRLSLGTLLVGHAIERAIAEGGRAFHFLRGREAYKFAWGAVDQPTFRLLVRRGTS